MSVRPPVTLSSYKRQYYRYQITDIRKKYIHKHHVIGHLLIPLLLEPAYKHCRQVSDVHLEMLIHLSSFSFYNSYYISSVSILHPFILLCPVLSFLVTYERL